MKTTKGILVGLIFLLCSGCHFNVPKWKIEKAAEFCADKKGIDHIEAGFDIRFVCGDGKDIIFKEGT